MRALRLISFYNKLCDFLDLVSFPVSFLDRIRQGRLIQNTLSLCTIIPKNASRFLAPNRYIFKSDFLLSKIWYFLFSFEFIWISSNLNHEKIKNAIFIRNFDFNYFSFVHILFFFVIEIFPNFIFFACICIFHFRFKLNSKYENKFLFVIFNQTLVE